MTQGHGAGLRSQAPNTGGSKAKAHPGRPVGLPSRADIPTGEHLRPPGAEAPGLGSGQAHEPFGPRMHTHPEDDGPHGSPHPQPKGKRGSPLSGPPQHRGAGEEAGLGQRAAMTRPGRPTAAVQRWLHSRGHVGTCREPFLRASGTSWEDTCTSFSDPRPCSHLTGSFWGRFLVFEVEVMIQQVLACLAR